MRELKAELIDLGKRHKDLRPHIRPVLAQLEQGRSLTNAQDRRMARHQKEAKSGSPNEAKYHVSAAIGELNDWEDTMLYYGDHMSREFQRDFGHAIDLLVELERLISKFENMNRNYPPQ